MPKENLFHVPGQNVEVGWSKGGEATIRVVPFDGPSPRSETISLAALDHSIAVLQRVRKQTFETTLAETLMDSKFLTRLAQETTSVWAGGPSTQPNVPNSEAYVTYRQGDTESESDPVLSGISQFVRWDSICRPTVDMGEYAQPGNPLMARNTLAYVYLREKRILEPTTLRWGRMVSRDSDGKLENANEYRGFFIRDFLELNTRFDNFLEIFLREAVFGVVHLEFPPEAFVHIDYMFPEECFIRAGQNSLESDINTALLRFQENNDMSATHAYCSTETFERIENPDQYDVIWCPAPTILQSKPDDVIKPNANKISFVNWKYEPLRVVNGPSADFDAPKDHTGKFAKGWRERDPSATQVLIEWSFIPIWDKPQVVVLELPE